MNNSCVQVPLRDTAEAFNIGQIDGNGLFKLSFGLHSTVDEHLKGFRKNRRIARWKLVSSGSISLILR